MKWIEVNIERRPDVLMDDYLIRLVKPILNESKAENLSWDAWHFLWEGNPWPSTLRLRFLGDDQEIEKLQIFLEKKLNGISHCYGEHGDCQKDKEYKGEANGGDGWGTKAWERGIKFLEFGSEFALELVENKDKLKKSQEYKQDIFDYADRYTHLFLNQISSLLDEADFDPNRRCLPFCLQDRKETFEGSNKLHSRRN